MTGFLIKGKFGHKSVPMPHEIEDRDQGDVSTSLGMPNIAKKPPEAWREIWNRFLLSVFRMN